MSPFAVFVAVALISYVAGDSTKPAANVFAGIETYERKQETHSIAGKEVAPHSRAYTVHLYVSGREKYVGTGALLTDQWILTSASFLEGAKNITAVVGAHTAKDLDNKKLFHDIVTVEKHPDYEPITGTNDIALIRMGLFAYLDGKLAQAIRLPAWSHRRQSYLRNAAEIAGFGLDEKRKPTVLRAVKFIVSDGSFCSSLYGSVRLIDTHMCVCGTTEKGSYGGYIGGPLVITEADGKPTVIGIHSRSTTDIDKPSAYTRVTNYLGWVQEIARISIRK